ncbi:MAG: HAD hydrolase family protein [Planctomycetes bacterium]|nr:HAD hydrolase family protein [Planctomycetota bacterium]
MDFASIDFVILDVDGVLTNGTIVATDGRAWNKCFHVHDGSAIRFWQRRGGEVAFLSGRDDEATRRRAEDLGVRHVRTGARDKLAGYDSLLAEARRGDGSVAYVGDDLPDLGPMARAALPVAVANAVGEVKRAARYVTRRPGGGGAVAEVLELILRKQRRWSGSWLAQA